MTILLYCIGAALLVIWALFFDRKKREAAP